MTEAQRRAARQRHQRESYQICSACHGSGLEQSASITARARKGGNRTYLASLEPDSLSMADRARLGGRPKDPTLADLLGSS